MISTILTPGVYTGLVDVELIREALNRDLGSRLPLYQSPISCLQFPS